MKFLDNVAGLLHFPMFFPVVYVIFLSEDIRQ